MLRIKALNDHEVSGAEDDSERVTKEAEETIIVSEYLRALKLKSDGRKEDAIKLFTELLEAEALDQLDTKCDKDKNKLFSVKYNTYRNLGFLCEELGQHENALNHLLSAVKMDDTDIFTLNRIGYLALAIKRPFLAQFAFQKCQELNPNHWLSMNGLLDALCDSQSVGAAYGQALHCFNRNSSHRKAIDVLVEVNEDYPEMIPMLEKCYKKGDFVLENVSHSGNERFFTIKCAENDEISTETASKISETSDFRMETLDWMSFGTLITKLYTKATSDNDLSLTQMYCFDDFYSEKQPEPMIEGLNDLSPDELSKNSFPEPSPGMFDLFNNEDLLEIPMTPGNTISELNGDVPEMTPMEVEDNQENEPPTENSIQVENNADLSQNDSTFQGGENTDTENGKKNDVESNSDIAALKSDSKRRRRGSELTVLEQWGWHKNRRSNRKKVEQAPVELIDPTINGFLRRILPQYFEKSYDTTTSLTPQESNTNPASTAINANDDASKTHNLEEFNVVTKETFDVFTAELKEMPSFDLYIVIQKYLQHLASLWTLHMPEEMRKMYCEVYEIYRTIFDYDTMNLVTDEELEFNIRIALFYLELRVNNQETEFPVGDLKLCTVLRFYVGFFLFAQNVYLEFSSRLMWIFVWMNVNQNNFEQALDYLESLKTSIESRDPEYTLMLPNLDKSSNSLINVKIINDSIMKIRRKISLRNTKAMYQAGEYEELAEVLKQSIYYSSSIRGDLAKSLVLNIHGQIQMLLESLWCQEKYSECLKWMEMSLCYGVDEFLAAPVHHPRRREWAETINFIFDYFEALLEQEDDDILYTLDEYLARLVQTLSRVVTHQLDTNSENSNKSVQNHLLNVTIPWVILYPIVQRTDDLNSIARKKALSIAQEGDGLGLKSIIYESMPNSVSLLFTSHDFLGRKKWCSRDESKYLMKILDEITPRLRSPELEHSREIIMEMLEQTTYCLYGYPPKRVRLKHIEEHDTKPIELSWERAIQLFDIYRPDNLPEFNSYKLESISSDMESLLARILSIMPKCLDISQFTSSIKDFISGTNMVLPNEMNIMPQRIQTIYYLRADYHFKNKDFQKARRFYVLDLTLRPNRFDSWVGLSLSKSNKIESKLNSSDPMNPKDFLEEAAKVMRCYEQCLRLNDKHRVVWIEFGNFTYNLHSYCSRLLKLRNDALTPEELEFVEKKKKECLELTHNAFSNLIRLCKAVESKRKDVDGTENGGEESENEDEEEGQDEKWLYYYMLGKISEKRKESPEKYLDYYLASARYLYENSATYPIRINHSNPTNLAIEALEVFYRITASIIKFLERKKDVTKGEAKIFHRVLKEVANSPFAFNRAKIRTPAVKRKATEMQNSVVPNAVPSTSTTENGTSENGEVQKVPKLEGDESVKDRIVENPTNGDVVNEENPVVTAIPTSVIVNGVDKIPNGSIPSPVDPKLKELRKTEQQTSRRGSQESTITTTSTSSKTSSSSGSGSSSSSDSDSDSDSSSSSAPEEERDDQPLKQADLDALYKICIKNLEECVTRFPEHYKSIYRLVNHFMNATGETKSLENCRLLLLSTYKTTLGSQIAGLFTERKNNNFFNGIWRIPVTEIDRPGNFSSHLTKCVIVLLDVLKQLCDHETLFDLAVHLNRTPDADKKYLKDTERNELFQKAIMFCVASFRSVLKKHIEAKNETSIMNLLLDISKAHRKSMKYMNQKDSLFGAVMSEVYKAYVEDKVTLPENANCVDLALKLCEHELKYRKYKEKLAADPGNADLASQPPVRPTNGENPFIPGVSKPRKSIEKAPKMSIPNNIPNISPSKIPGLMQDLAKLQDLHKNPISSSISASTANAATSSSAYKDSMATLASMMNAPSAFSSLNPFASGLSTIETMALMSLFQQHSSMYSQFSALTSMSSAPNYNQFLNKYMQEVLAGGGLGAMSATMGFGSNSSGKMGQQQPKKVVDSQKKDKPKKEKKPKMPQMNTGSQNPMSLLKDIAMKGGVSVLPVSNNAPTSSSGKLQAMANDYMSKQQKYNSPSTEKPKPKKQKLNSGDAKTVNFTPSGLPQLSFADLVKMDLPKSLSITPSGTQSPSPVISTPSGLTISPSKASAIPSSSNLSSPSTKNQQNLGLTVTPVNNNSQISSNKPPKQKKSQNTTNYKNIPGLNSLPSISVIPEAKLQSPFQLEFAKQMTLSSSIDLTKSTKNVNKKQGRDSPKNFNQKLQKQANKVPNKMPTGGSYNQFPNLKLPEISVSPVLSHSSLSPAGSAGSAGSSKPGTPNSSGSSRTNPVPARNSTPLSHQQQKSQQNHNYSAASLYMGTSGNSTNSYKSSKQQQQQMPSMDYMSQLSQPTKTLQQILAEKQKANQSRNTVVQSPIPQNNKKSSDTSRNSYNNTPKSIPSGQSLLKNMNDQQQQQRPPSSKKQKQLPTSLPVDIIVVDD